MKILLVIIFTLHCIVSYTAGGGDSTSMSRKPFFKHKRQKTTSPIIQKMNDAQLMLLIHHMFEATCIPSDLWSEVMMETAKRNLSKINRQSASAPSDEFDADITLTGLYVEKLLPVLMDIGTVAPRLDPDMIFLHPATNYYNEWGEDLSTLFRDEFTADTTFTLELENSEYGCFNMPSRGTVSSAFGWRHSRYHKGIDIQLRKGDTVACAFDGMVRFAQKKGGYGNVVIVRHYNGLETVYAHLYKIKVKEGEVVAAGELIGLAGSTGKSTGPHLHFEVRFMGAPVNPQYFISFDSGSLLFKEVVFKKNKAGLLAAFHPDTEFHTVKKGETWAEIANHYATTTSKLREMNNMAPKQYMRLKQGQTLRVRWMDYSGSASK